jgi:hypothetical protein
MRVARKSGLLAVRIQTLTSGRGRSENGRSEIKQKPAGRKPSTDVSVLRAIAQEKNMSTRSTTHFVDSEFPNQKPVAIVYRHSDGYPEGAGMDIMKFLRACKKLQDSRLNDPAYLAAKYVVFLADMFNNKFTKFEQDGTCDESHKSVKAGEYGYKRAASKLDFLSVGILQKDPGDIEYRYVIDCGKLVKGLPTVTCYAVSERDGVWSQSEVKIPTRKSKG